MEPEQLEKFAMFFALQESFAETLRDAPLFELYKLSGLERGRDFNPKALHGIKEFSVSAYECPGTLETLAEVAGLGWTAFTAYAMRSKPDLRLYGIEGASRNKHLRDLRREELEEVIRDRKSLASALNFEYSTATIDIPAEMSAIPPDFAIARFLIETGYEKRLKLDKSSIMHLSKTYKLTQSRKAREILRKIHEKPYVPRGGDLHRKPKFNLSLNELKALEEFAAEFGTKVLNREGIYSLTDIILQGPAFKFSKALTGHSPEYAGELERKREIWRRLLPGDFAEVMVERASKINSAFNNSLPSEKGQSIEYFIGEVIAIIRELNSQPENVHIKIGNSGETHWDGAVFSVLEQPETKSGAIRLMGKTLGRRETLHSKAFKFASLLYSHFTFSVPEDDKKPQTYISYGIAPNMKQISNVPLISDDLQTLRAKFEKLERANYCEIPRLVVGAMYAMLNRGSSSSEGERYGRNRRALLEAARFLPEAYMRAIVDLDLKNIPNMLLSKIGKKKSTATKEEAEREDGIRKKKGEFYLAGISDFEDKLAAVSKKIESARGGIESRLTEFIKSRILTLDRIDHNAVELAATYLPDASRIEFHNVSESLKRRFGNDDIAIHNGRLNSLANALCRIYANPSHKEGRSQSLTGLLEEPAKGNGGTNIADVYDRKFDDELASIMRYIDGLKAAAEQLKSRSSPSDRHELESLRRKQENLAEAITQLRDKYSQTCSKYDALVEQFKKKYGKEFKPKLSHEESEDEKQSRGARDNQAKEIEKSKASLESLAGEEASARSKKSTYKKRYFDESFDAFIELNYRIAGLQKIKESISVPEHSAYYAAAMDTIRSIDSLIAGAGILIRDALDRVVYDSDRHDFIRYAAERFRRKRQILDTGPESLKKIEDNIEEAKTGMGKAKKEKDIEGYKKAERGLRTSEGNLEAKKRELVKISSGEALLLAEIERRYAEIEMGLLKAARSLINKPYGLLPHELQQMVEIRSTLKAWAGYFKAAELSIEGKSKQKPVNPAFLAPQPSSQSYISAEQAASFFSAICAHISNEGGADMIERQKTKAEAMKYYTGIRAPKERGETEKNHHTRILSMRENARNALAKATDSGSNGPVHYRLAYLDVLLATDDPRAPEVAKAMKGLEFEVGNVYLTNGKTSAANVFFRKFEDDDYEKKHERARIVAGQYIKAALALEGRERSDSLERAMQAYNRLENQVDDSFGDVALAISHLRSTPAESADILKRLCLKAAQAKFDRPAKQRLDMRKEVELVRDLAYVLAAKNAA